MRFGILLLVFAAMSGCQYDPYAHLYTTAKPRPADVAGTYRLVEQTVTSGGVGALGDRACRVELRADGTFVASHVPPADVRPSGRGLFDSLVSGKGRWEIVSVGTVDFGSGDARTHWGVGLEPESGKMMAPGLTKEGPPYGLIFTIGDPDAGDVLILEKVE